MPAVVGAVRQRAARAFGAESDRWLVAILGGVVAAAVADDVERGDLLAGRPQTPVVAYNGLVPRTVDARRPRCNDVEEDDLRCSDDALSRSVDDAVAAVVGAAKATQTGGPPDRARGRRPAMPRGAAKGMKKGKKVIYQPIKIPAIYDSVAGILMEVGVGGGGSTTTCAYREN